MYGTACGVWGDILTGLGFFLNDIGEGKILYLGNNDLIVDFLKEQPFIKQVKKLQVDEKLWRRYWIYSVFHKISDEYPDYMPKPEDPFLNQGLKQSEFKITHLTYDKAQPDQPIYQWQNAKLPKYIEDWARETAKTLPKNFYLYQPYSFNSNSPDDHWPYWNELTDLLLKRTNKNLVIIGNNWIPSVYRSFQYFESNKIFSLYNQTPSMLHVFGLAKYAVGTITTSNSLAHWCQIQNLPCTVISNRKSTRKHYYFRRVLEWPTIEIAEFSSSIQQAFNACGDGVFKYEKLI